jgi:predicted transcriptional regulator
MTKRRGPDSWQTLLAEAEMSLEQQNANEAFRRGFGALELCYTQAAGFRVSGNRDRFGEVSQHLLDQKKISRGEYDQAIYLSEARNLVSHRFGFEPSLAEARRCCVRIRGLCARFGLCVSDVMAKPVHTARPADRVGDYLAEMRQFGFWYFPVVDDKGCVIGTLDEWALLDAIRKDDGLFDPNQPVSAYMSEEVLPEIPANATLDEAAARIKKTGRVALLVLTARKPTGIITAFDLIH